MNFAEVNKKFDINDVAEHFVSAELNEIGNSTFEFEEGECPLCGHKGCFRINKQDKPGYFHCFSCGEGGDAVKLVQKLFNVNAFRAGELIIESLSSEVSADSVMSTDWLVIGVDEENEKPTDEEIKVDDELRSDLFYWTTVHYNGNLFTELNGMEYQRNVRGHKYKSLEHFDIGYSDGNLKEKLLSMGANKDDLSRYSLVNSQGNDFFPENVFIYPHINEENEICSFSFKDPEKKRQWQLPNSVKNKSIFFFGQQTLARFPDEILIVEGENDLLSLWDIGWSKGILATTGQISKRQQEYLHVVGDRYREQGLAVPKFITLFDSDEAGESYRNKVSKLGLENILQVKIHNANDIDELIQTGEVDSEESLRKLFKEYVWKPMPNFTEAGLEDDDVTEMDHALRLLHVLKNRGRYVLDQKQWILWDDGSWREDAALLVKHELKQVSRYWKSLLDNSVKQLRKEHDADERERLLAEIKFYRAQVKKLSSKSGTDNIASMAITEPCVQISVKDLNKNPQLIGLKNGVYDLDRMCLIESTPELLITKQLPFSFDRYAKCPTWEKFIEETVTATAWQEVGKTLTEIESKLDASKMREFLQEVAGITLSGKPNVKGFFYFIGKKDTGKSVFTNLLLELTGGYGKSITPQSLMTGSMQGGDVKAPEIAGLDGVRLALASEAPEGARLNEDLIKRLTGADPVTARGNYCNPVTFMPQLTQIFSANERPALTSVSQAFWERMMVVPFLNRVPAEKQDRELAQKLKEELPGIFLWCLDGWRRFQDRGFLEVPERVKAYNKNLCEGQDVLGEFLWEMVEKEVGAFIACDVLYTQYKHYMEKAGLAPLGRPRFVSKLEDLGISRVRKRFGLDKNPRFYYQGLAYLADSGFECDFLAKTHKEK